MTRQELLDAASKCVNGKRQEDYGSPERSFDNIRDMWNAYLGDRLTDPLTDVDIPIMMNLFKIARIKGPHMTYDSFIDAIGYMACAGEIATKIISSDAQTADNNAKTRSETTMGPIGCPDDFEIY